MNNTVTDTGLNLRTPIGNPENRVAFNHTLLKAMIICLNNPTEFKTWVEKKIRAKHNGHT
jgi:hypothetical protein